MKLFVFGFFFSRLHLAIACNCEHTCVFFALDYSVFGLSYGSVIVCHYARLLWRAECVIEWSRSALDNSLRHSHASRQLPPTPDPQYTGRRSNQQVVLSGSYLKHAFLALINHTYSHNPIRLRSLSFVKSHGVNVSVLLSLEVD